jgi:hypothetical protein
MLPQTYVTRRLLRQSKKGASKPAIATLNAILTFDCDESPFGVYNELVATRLGQMLNAPVAAGVLTMSGDGQTYAGIETGSHELVLPDVFDARLGDIADKYPSETAALVAFDLWIGNDDRHGNLKASLHSQHIRIFAGFDHAICLLGHEDDTDKLASRLEALKIGELLIPAHPFFGLIDALELSKWVSRITGVSDDLVREACVFGKTFRSVSIAMQSELAEALVARKRLLPGIVASHAPLIVG